MGYCGSDIGISTCAGDAALQHGSTMNVKIHHLTIQTLVLSSHGTRRQGTREIQLQSSPMKILMFRAEVMAGFMAQEEVWRHL